MMKIDVDDLGGQLWRTDSADSPAAARARGPPKQEKKHSVKGSRVSGSHRQPYSARMHSDDAQSASSSRRPVYLHATELSLGAGSAWQSGQRPLASDNHLKSARPMSTPYAGPMAGEEVHHHPQAIGHRPSASLVQSRELSQRSRKPPSASGGKPLAFTKVYGQPIRTQHDNRHPQRRMPAEPSDSNVIGFAIGKQAAAPTPSRFSDSVVRQKLDVLEPRVQSMSEEQSHAEHGLMRRDSAKQTLKEERTAGPSDGLIRLDSQGVPVIGRTTQARQANSRVLNLNSLKLTEVPELEGESGVRSVFMCNNFIRRPQRLDHLRYLWMLDLHDNMIETLDGVQQLTSLQILKVSKNCIEEIDFIWQLKNLQVLELQSNRISKIPNLSPLINLKQINFSSNFISCVENLEGLTKLKEASLHHNLVTHVVGLESLPSLQRLDLGKNRIERFADMDCVRKCPKLCELYLNDNPLAKVADIDLMIVNALERLLHFNDQAVTEEFRLKASAHASRVARKKETVKRKARAEHKFQLAQLWAKEHWAAEHKDVECLANCAECIPEQTATADATSKKSRSGGFLQGSKRMSFAGCGCLRQFKERGASVHEEISAIGFEFVTLAELADHFAHISNVFPQIKRLDLYSTGMSSLLQIDLLWQAFPRLEALTISTSGNPVTELPYWRDYALFCFPDGQLHTLNDQCVSDEMRVMAKGKFKTLAQLQKGIYVSDEQFKMRTDRSHDMPPRPSMSDHDIIRVVSELDVNAINGRARPDELSNMTKEEFPCNVGVAIDCLPAAEIASANRLDAILTASIHLHQLTETFDTTWPRIENQIALDAIMRIRDVGRYEAEAMSCLLQQLES